MKTAVRALVAAALLATAHGARATPSTTFWTPSTTYTQPYLVPHITYDTYFGEPGMYPVDTGLTIGVLPFEAVNAEIGFDVLYGGGLVGKEAWSLNGKLSLVEGKLAQWQPGLSVGIFGVGFEEDVTDYNILHATMAKTFPYVGNIGVGVYSGLNDKLLVDKDGNEDATGLFLSWMGPEIPVGVPGLKKIIPAVDYQSGNNALSAVGGGLYFYFTDAIDLLVGPVYFFEPELQPGGADWLFTAQIDVDFDLRKK
jgi:hypothetical protein